MALVLRLVVMTIEYDLVSGHGTVELDRDTVPDYTYWQFYFDGLSDGKVNWIDVYVGRYLSAALIKNEKGEWSTIVHERPKV